MQVATNVYCSVPQSITVVYIYIGLTMWEFLLSPLIMCVKSIRRPRRRQKIQNKNKKPNFSETQ